VWLLAGALALVVPVLLAVVVAAWRARLEAPAPTLLVRDRHGAFLAEIGDGRDAELGYWPVATLPPRVAAATIALEDRRFWRHPGVDPLAIGRALVQNAREGRRVSGASTLAMQVARMQHPGRRTLPRKAVEALTAVLLTVRYDRAEILAHYLRLAPYGNRVRGIAFAARRYLDKPVEDLSWAEIAFLAAIPQAPARMNPLTASGHARAVARGRRILAELHGRGVTTAAEHELALAQIASLPVPRREGRPLEALHLILRLERRLGAPATRRALAGRPLVSATVDLELQRRVAGMVRDAVAGWAPLGAGNAAVVVVDPASREVLACVGSTDYFDGGRAGAIDYTAVPRSPGSTLKPFLYALALERGVITPATVLDDLRRAPGGIANADGTFLGPLLPRVALANSRNVPAANLLARVGLDEGYGFLRDLGLHDGATPARTYGLGLAVGGMPVTLERLVRASAVLAGDGRLGELVWVRGEAAGERRRVLSASTAREIALHLADPMARLPSFPRMGASEYPFPVAVKTGTSPDVRDAWTVAFSSRALVGVWVGRPDYRSMTELTGFGSAATLARAVLLHLHRDQRQGLDDLSFPPPEGFVPARLCQLTGALASPLCERTLEEWLPPGQVPVDICTAHVRLGVDSRSGLVATTRTPRRFVQERVVTELPPRYAAWAAAAGLAPPPPAGGGAGPAASAPGALPRAVGGDGAPARLRVTSPEHGARLVRDPETPATLATVALGAVVEPRAVQVVWLVDGRPFRTVDHPYTARWPLTPGVHTFQARVPFTPYASRIVQVTVE
jgi:penicillin-binding protein 1C